MRPLGQDVPGETAQIAILSVSALVGGGFLGYQAVRSMQEGGLFSVAEHEPQPLGIVDGVAILGGLYLTWEALKETAQDIGMEPLVYAGVGISALAGVLWLKSRL